MQQNILENKKKINDMETDKIDLRKYITAVKHNWLWAVAVFVVVMGLAVTYCARKMLVHWEA